MATEITEEEVKKIFIINPDNEFEVMCYVGGDENGGYQFFQSFTKEIDAENFITEKENQMKLGEQEAEKIAVTNAFELADFWITLFDSIGNSFGKNSTELLEGASILDGLVKADSSFLENTFNQMIGKYDTATTNFFSITGPTYYSLTKKIDEKEEEGTPLSTGEVWAYHTGYTFINTIAAEIMGQIMTAGVSLFKKGNLYLGTTGILLAQSIAEELCSRFTSAFENFMNPLPEFEIGKIQEFQNNFFNHLKESGSLIIEGNILESGWETLKENYDFIHKIFGYENMYISDKINDYDIVYEIDVNTPAIFQGAEVIFNDIGNILTFNYQSNDVEAETTFKQFNRVIGSIESINEYINLDTNSIPNFVSFFDEERFSNYISRVENSAFKTFDKENIFYYEMNQENNTESINLVLNNNYELSSFVEIVKENFISLYNSCESISIDVPATNTLDPSDPSIPQLGQKYIVEKVSLEEIMELTGMKDIAVENNIISNEENLFNNVMFDSSYVEEQLSVLEKLEAIFLKSQKRIAEDGSFVILVYGQDLNDILFPLIGNENSNILFGTHKTDTLKGNGGDDIIFGWGQDANEQTGDVNTWSETNGDSDAGDNIYGGDGADHIYGGKGNDNLYGAYGSSIADDDSDTFYFEDGDGFDTIKGAKKKIGLL